MSLNQELMADPLAFAHKYSILGDNDAATPAVQQGMIGEYHLSKMKGLAKIAYLNCVRMELSAELHSGTHKEPEQRDLMVNEGADTVKIIPTKDGMGEVPAFFLPWDYRGGTVKLSIPSLAKFELNFWGANKSYGGSAIGGSQIVKNYPKFFLTAAINGCSVFVTGADTEPTVYHCGKSGDVPDAINMWRETVTKLAGKAADGMGEANKSHYVKDGVTKDANNYNTTARAMEFTKALNEAYEQRKVRIQEVRPWGAVFGTCNDFGRWTFYLQENATIRYDIVDKKMLGLRKKVKPFSVSRPMKVRQIFPGGGTAAMKSEFSWMPL
jgi:hypothetical protein